MAVGSQANEFHEAMALLTKTNTKVKQLTTDLMVKETM
jgi:hypothetical protein